VLFEDCIILGWHFEYTLLKGEIIFKNFVLYFTGYMFVKTNWSDCSSRGQIWRPRWRRRKLIGDTVISVGGGWGSEEEERAVWTVVLLSVGGGGGGRTFSVDGGFGGGESLE
jgi:hypothetical protein